MTPCLRPEDFVDTLDGRASRDSAAHVAMCPQCRATLAEIRATLAEAEHTEVPEPSPLFWSQLNARVHASINNGTSAEAPGGWWAWLRWDVVVPLAAVATVAVALASAVDRWPAAPSTPTTPPVADTSVAMSDTSLAVADDDSALGFMFDLTATLPGSEWDALGVSVLPDLGVASQALSADEQQALSVLLQAAVERPSS